MVRERPGSRHVCGGSLDSRSWKRRLTDSSCYGSLKGRLRLHVYGMTHGGKNKHTSDLLMCRATAKERATCDHAHIISSVYLCCGRRLWRAPSRRVTVQHDEPADRASCSLAALGPCGPRSWSPHVAVAGGSVGCVLLRSFCLSLLDRPAPRRL